MTQVSPADPNDSRQKRLRVTNYFGQSMRVLPEDTIGSALIKHGLYDRKGVCLMNAVLRELRNPIVLDIGANIGNHSLAMSTVARQIYSFEPQSEIFALLQENIADINNIEALNLGLSSHDQTMDLFIPAADNNGAATLRSELKSDDAVTETIHLRKGDEVISELHLPHVDMIKIDVEGFEIEVLNGLEQTISRFKPIIFMEWDQAITRDDAAHSRLFERMLRDYQAWYIGTNYDRDHWPQTTLGRLRRSLFKLRHHRQWILREADLEQSFSNLVLVPPHQQSTIAAIGPVSLD